MFLNRIKCSQANNVSTCDSYFCWYSQYYICYMCIKCLCCSFFSSYSCIHLQRFQRIFCWHRRYWKYVKSQQQTHLLLVWFLLRFFLLPVVCIVGISNEISFYFLLLLPVPVVLSLSARCASDQPDSHLQTRKYEV